MKAKSTQRTAKPTELVRGEPVVRTVLAATLAELAHSGYRGLRIEDVATRAGVNKTTIYRRWPTKEDLVGAAFRSITGDKLVAPNTGSLRGDLLALARTIIASARTPEGQSLFRVMVAEGPDSEIMGIVRAQVEADKRAWRAIFEGHEASGELTQGVDSTILFDILVSYLHHKFFAERMRFGAFDIESFVDVLLFGVQSPAKRPKAAPKRRASRGESANESHATRARRASRRA